MIGGVRVNLEEEVARKGHEEGADGQEGEKRARVGREEQAAEEREEERAKTEGSQREGGSSSSMMGPVEGRRLDGSIESHTAAQASEEREYTEDGHRSRPRFEGSANGKVTERKQQRASNDGGAGATMVDKQADGNAHGVHAEIPCEADKVGLSGGEVQLVSELRSPSRVHILLQHGKWFSQITTEKEDKDKKR